MRKPIALGIFGLLLACSPGIGGGRMFAATPTFTISASNVTMPTAGNGPIPFTVTSLDGYSGTIGFTCSATNPPAGAKLPTCIGPEGPGVSISLAANQTVNSECVLIPPGTALPPSTASRYGQGLVVALAGALVAGSRMRRRANRWLVLALLGVAASAAAVSISACGGGNSNSMTPGTYSYTLTGTDANGLSANATTNVTIP